MRNVRDINFFTKKFTNYWCNKWLLVNKKNDVSSEYENQ